MIIIMVLGTPPANRTQGSFECALYSIQGLWGIKQPKPLMTLYRSPLYSLVCQCTDIRMGIPCMWHIPTTFRRGCCKTMQPPKQYGQVSYREKMILKVAWHMWRTSVANLSSEVRCQVFRTKRTVSTTEWRDNVGMDISFPQQKLGENCTLALAAHRNKRLPKSLEKRTILRYHCPLLMRYAKVLNFAWVAQCCRQYKYLAPEGTRMVTIGTYVIRKGIYIAS